MKLFFIGNGNSSSSSLSGGAVRLVELFKRWSQPRFGVDIEAWVTEGGYRMFKDYNINVRCNLIRSYLFMPAERYLWQKIWAYIISTIHSLFKLVFIDTDFDIIYTCSDFFYDVIPAFFLKRRIPKAKWVVTIHHLYTNPSYRKGNYLVNLGAWLVQKLSFRFIAARADRVFVYDTDAGDNVKRVLTQYGLNDIAISRMYNGVNFSVIDKIDLQAKCFDACFVGRLRPSKGIFDLVPIWNEVVQIQPKARLSIVGQYDKHIGDLIKAQIEKYKLYNNIILRGYVDDIEKYCVIKSSKVFISPSYEEGWGIAICEALACGISVVAYDLPAYSRIFDGFIKCVSVGDTGQFARAVLEIIQAEEYLEDCYKRKAFVRRYDWDKIADEELEIIRRDNERQ